MKRRVLITFTLLLLTAFSLSAYAADSDESQTSKQTSSSQNNLLLKNFFKQASYKHLKKTHSDCDDSMENISGGCDDD